MVGPNGSGKSNVIDAMLFVFGKRAKQVVYFSPFRFILDFYAFWVYYSFENKMLLQMRLNKVSELIHNSTNHQNLDCASVTVYFQEIIDLVISIRFMYIAFICCWLLNVWMLFIFYFLLFVGGGDV